LGERGFDRGLDRQRRAGRAELDAHARGRRRVLRHRDVHRRLRILAKRLILGVRDEPDDLDRRTLALPLLQLELFAEYLARLEELPRSRLVDDRDALRRWAVVLIEVAAGEQWRAERG